MDKKEQIEKDSTIEGIIESNNLPLMKKHLRRLYDNYEIATKRELENVYEKIELLKQIEALSQPKEVDLDKLRKMADIAFANFECKSLNLINKNEWNGIVDFAVNFASHLPYLQKPVESDAVEFAEWKDKEYPAKFYKGYAKHNSTEWFTIKQLYSQFKQLKK